MTKQFPNKKNVTGFFGPCYRFLLHLDVDTKICLESEYMYLQVYYLD